MGTRLLHSSATSSHAIVYTRGISDKSFCAAAGAKLRGAETQLVMADSRIIGNVVQPLARSVVEPSTTDVDANNIINEHNASGESISNTISNTQVQKKQSKENSNEAEESGTDSISAGLMNSRYAGTKDTDTESVGTSRPGSTSPTKMDTIKKSSLRKSTFKSVSVNKVFLKDAAPTQGPVSNTLSSSLSNKASPAFSVAQPTPRNLSGVSKLKLVKTGASSQTLRLGSSGPTGAVGSKKGEQVQPVWNKNLPTPPPPKKDVTDEELKNSFGIHLAQRLGSDESKETKWADIDDDDEDWVPEVIEWNDGMKVTLEDATATIEETTASPPTVSVEPARPETLKEVALPPKSPLSTPAVPVKEEIRPKTLITEKPSLKPTEPLSNHPTRASPWAKITPTVPPQTIMNSTQIRNSDFPPSRQDTGSESSVQHTLSSTTGMKEVSADVYDRSWRERPVSHGPRERELFNSETGQLEPVREARNGGVRPGRNDIPMNKPSVLQRPTGPPQHSQLSGPAEPSAAFQQSRTSMAFGRPEEYGRRRASSNVSGGSGSTGGRRPSFSTSRFSADQPPTPDDARFPIDPRRSSFGHNNNPFDIEGARGSHNSSGPYSPQFQHSVPHLREISPRMAVVSPVLGRPGPQFTRPATIQMVPPPPPSAPPFDPNYEDPIAQQERVMKESRETARKRRQEEEAKEELAKQERLRIKLEALEKQAEEAAKKKAIAEKAEAERAVAEEKRLIEEKAAMEKRAADEKAAVERRAEEDAAAKKAAEARQALERERPRQVPFSDRQVRQPPASLVRGQSPGNAAGIPTAPQAQGRRQSGPAQSQRSPTKNFAILGNRESRDQPWKNVPPGPDRYTSWGGTQGNNGQSQNSTDGNPWGPIEKPRFPGFNSVGNGTFDTRYSGFSPRSNAPSSMHGQQNRDDRRPGRSGPTSPGYSRGPRPNDSISQEDRSQAVNRWNTVANNLQNDETAERRKNREERLAKEAEDTVAGIKKEPVAQPKIVETWTKVGGEVDRKLVAVSKTERDEATARRNSLQSATTSNPSGSSAITSAPIQPAAGTSQSQTTHIIHRNNIPTGPAASRPASRFFPAAAANLLAQHLGSQNKLADEPAPKVNPPGSPPPPMSSEHPVHGDRNSRIVHLPPSPQSQQASGRISPSTRLNNGLHKTDNQRSPRPPGPSGFTAFEAVQQKILEMRALSKQNSPPQQQARLHQQESKASASKDFSATKPTYEETPERTGRPSVSLPGSSHGSKDSSEKGDVTSSGEVQMDGGCILSKPDDEEFFHGLFERDFGSTPTVKIPHQAPNIFHNGSLSNKSPVSTSPKKGKGPLSKLQQPQTIHMFDAFASKDFVNVEGKKFVPVHLPGGSLFEVVYKGQEGRKGKRQVYTKPRSSRFGTSNGHMGHGRGGGSVGNVRKVAEAT